MNHDNTSDNHCPPALMSSYGNTGVDAFLWSECSAPELEINRYRYNTGRYDEHSDGINNNYVTTGRHNETQYRD
ncbi:hypothetical protein DPMN_165451 [Dreissena polymorpha]|uniref:Uncharacterized protein n=1 Tax=Dreissena polymorpha TaxID=45954 RepID=A0A9D4EUV0_DREPO|nr:hypothetical protein DPMN_165451 [Dreissena polymorpha]